MRVTKRFASVLLLDRLIPRKSQNVSMNLDFMIISEVLIYWSIYNCLLYSLYLFMKKKMVSSGPHSTTLLVQNKYNTQTLDLLSN